MNEEQAVLDFFSKPENLPLALSVAERVDEIRCELNNQFWQQLLLATFGFLQAELSSWRLATTEDKNAPTQLVGMHCNLAQEQALFLRPMLEQQLLGDTWRVYVGLMWSAPPTPEHLMLPEVITLKEQLCATRYKSNEGFLAWQWTKLHPRQTDFLLRFAQSPQRVIDEALTELKVLIIDKANELRAANTALSKTPRSMGISLTQLHRSKSAKSD